MGLDKEMLVGNLESILGDTEKVESQSRMLRRLLLVLAGDQRVISGLSLEDLAELFSMSTWLLGIYNKVPVHSFMEEKLEHCKNACRRAV